MMLGQSMGKKLANRIGRYEFEVGILDDKPHKQPVDGGLFGVAETTDYAGGPIRKIDRSLPPEDSTAAIFIQNQERLNIDMLRAPFEDESSEIVRFMNEFMKFASGGKVSIKRIENLLQAVVRNPILREDYGSNETHTADAKGFDRHLFDTGQMFKAIKARAKRV